MNLVAPKNMRERWGRLGSMLFHDPAMIVEAMFLPLFLLIGFRFNGVQKTQTRLRKWVAAHSRKSTGANPDSVISSALRAQRIVKRMSGIEGSCLVRSLSLWAILLRRGVNSGFRIGMRRTGGRMEGHTWLEIDGVALNEKQAVIRTYTILKEPLSFDQMTRN